MTITHRLPAQRPQPQPPAQQPPAQPPAEPKPWSALQQQTTQLGTTPDGLIHLDGVRWDIENLPNGEAIEKGVFNDAVINPNKIKDVFLLIKPFTDQPMGFPGHALINFEFEADSPVTNKDGGKDSGLAVSVEVHFHQGEKYDANMKNPIIYQLGTWNDALEKANVYDHNPLQRYKLKLTPEQKVALLHENLAKATQYSDSNIYDSVTNSCLSNLIDNVNAIIPEEQRIPKLLPDGQPDPAATVPIWCTSSFQSHNLLQPGKPDVFPAAPKPQPPAGNAPPALLMS